MEAPYEWRTVLIPQDSLLIILNSYYYLFYLDFISKFKIWKKNVFQDYRKFIEHSFLINLTIHLFWLQKYIDESFSYSIGIVLFLPFIHVLYFIHKFTVTYFQMLEKSWGRYYCRNCIYFLILDLIGFWSLLLFMIGVYFESFFFGFYPLYFTQMYFFYIFFNINMDHFFKKLKKYLLK
jgi:hypothetical protein